MTQTYYDKGRYNYPQYLNMEMWVAVKNNDDSYRKGMQMKVYLHRNKMNLQCLLHDFISS